MKADYINGFLNITADLLTNEKVMSMTGYRHHGDITTHYHSMHVAYATYIFTEKLKLNEPKAREITRASLLHDLYLYEWYTEKHEQNHIFYHPKQAAINAEKYIGNITKMQKEMIERHMFPLAKPPKSLGGWMLTLTDKYCTAREISGLSSDFTKIYDTINRQVSENDS